MMAPSASVFDVAVVGAGPTGLAAAVAIAESGCRTALIERAMPADAPKDTRTTALMGASLTLLQNLGIWSICLVHGAPIRTIRLADATGRLLRAPTVNFHARDVGLDAFGYNVPNRFLTAALRERAGACDSLSTIPCAGVSGAASDAHRVRLTTREGRVVEAKLVVGADGRGSICRNAAGIGTSERRYPQSALACTVEHAAPHEDVSTELHREAGPLTLVPLPSPHASGLVWVERPEEAERLFSLSDAAIAEALESHVGSFAARVTHVGPRSLFPLSYVSAERIAAKRIALVGEAAHVLPPIGAQGLNLGFRDVAALADIVGAAASIGEDPGSGRVMDAYARARRTDIATRAFGVDLLNRSLLTDLLPAQAMRGIGLHLLGAFPPLRRLAMRAGLGPLGPRRLSA